jgi:hypothetical protein
LRVGEHPACFEQTPFDDVFGERRAFRFEQFLDVARRDGMAERQRADDPSRSAAAGSFAGAYAMMPPAAYNWSGFYVGGNLSAGVANGPATLGADNVVGYRVRTAS